MIFLTTACYRSFQLYEVNIFVVLGSGKCGKFGSSGATPRRRQTQAVGTRVGDRRTW
ncbi:MAG: hypothetical protein WBA93_14655 [Microcoleaceae cyanobacterium]